MCPVCHQSVTGDPDVVDAHVDACLAHAAALAAAGEVEVNVDIEDDDGWAEVPAEGGGTRLVRTGPASVRGAGFDIVASTNVDEEVEVDVDGDDEATFGAAQFFEHDVVHGDAPLTPVASDDFDGEGDNDGVALRALLVEGKALRENHQMMEEQPPPPEDQSNSSEMWRVEMNVRTARKAGDMHSLICALGDKIRLLVSFWYKIFLL
jgi:hypothetical protein